MTGIDEHDPGDGIRMLDREQERRQARVGVGHQHVRAADIAGREERDQVVHDVLA
jgi:hypothetical protein